jgi:hypothetical protein
MWWFVSSSSLYYFISRSFWTFLQKLWLKWHLHPRIYMSGKIDRTVSITAICILLSVCRILPVGCGCSQLTRHQVNDWWFHTATSPIRLQGLVVVQKCGFTFCLYLLPALKTFLRVSYRYFRSELSRLPLHPPAPTKDCESVYYYIPADFTLRGL